ncbi:MAG: glycosyl hydrolase family 28 protein [Oscillospiraceae bacterium]|nr:glycosyl hydrolase family 28 protein [Oscillospiraceae bacterium]
MNKVYITDFGAGEGVLNNAEAIQAAIDGCAAGGTVVIPAGTFVSGAIKLCGNMTLYLEKGAVLQGSGDCRDYEKHASRGWRDYDSLWFDAFICAEDAENVNIEGEGTIDGVDCFNPKGEEGFRGPHCMRFVRCKNMRISGLHIKRSANYAMFFINSSNLSVDNVSVCGGHDGIHSHNCNNAVVSGCDFRTGDDCVAGSDNINFMIRDCKFNTSCNGFRLGCLNLTAERCQFWGPGEFLHLSQKRNNMLCAIIHFSPPDRNPLLPSGNWQLDDITADNCETLYHVARSEPWQSGQPVFTVKFENTRATNIERPVTVADERRDTALSFKDSSIELRPGITGKSVIKCDGFDSLELKNVKLAGNAGAPAVDICDGNRASFENTGILAVDIRAENIKSANFLS